MYAHNCHSNEELGLDYTMVLDSCIPIGRITKQIISRHQLLSEIASFLVVQDFEAAVSASDMGSTEGKLGIVATSNSPSIWPSRKILRNFASYRWSVKVVDHLPMSAQNR